MRLKPAASRAAARTRVVGWVLFGAVVVLGALAFFAAISEFMLPDGAFPGDRTFRRLFLLDNEHNIPTWFSSTLFLGAAGLSFVLGFADRVERKGWNGLGVVFTVLSMDEAASLHESVNSSLRTAFHLSGPLRFAWILPASVLVVIFVLIYARFLWRLPRITRRRLILAGLVFVGGAVGIEAVGGWYWDAYGSDTFGYRVVTNVEELAEMAGLSLLIVALLAHIETFRPRLVVRGAGDEG